MEIPQPGLEMPEMSPPTGLTSALHSGSFACRPGISLMAEDRLPLHEVTLLWYVTLERLASDFFSDAVGGNRFQSWFDCPPRAWILPAAKEKLPCRGHTLPSSDVPFTKKWMWPVGPLDLLQTPGSTACWCLVRHRTYGDLPELLNLSVLIVK